MTRTMMKLWLLLLALLALSAFAPRVGGQAEKPYRLEGNEVKVAGAVAFAEGSDRLLPESEKALDAVKAYLDDKSFITTLRVEGHTEAGGDAASNQTLSERRALAVARRLVAKGVDCKRLVAVGFGSTKPIAPGDTPEGRAKNRRVAFFNAALRGRLIGGAPADGGGRTAGDVCVEK